jgi:uncharacterized BrkB/YihY/UPF0761 family membrane protein
MFRVRTILILVGIAIAVYSLLPSQRKRRIRDKLREVWVATIVAIALYWAFMLGAAAWNRWG